MANNQKRYVRKQYLVAKKFQLKYVGLILLFMFLTAALCSYVVYYTSMILLGEKLANVYPQGRLVSIVRIVNFRILLSVLLVSPFVAIIGIFLSHRIAGPIDRMEKFLDGIASGNLSSYITLRTKDELISLADGINRVVDSSRGRIGKQKEVLSRVLVELEGLKKGAESKTADISSTRDAISKMEKEIASLRDELEKYKLK